MSDRVAGKVELAVGDVAAFLGEHHGAPVASVELLRGGFWSAAYGYEFGGRQLVVRFGEMRDGFEADRAAMAYGEPDLPIPEVLDIGEAFGRSFAVSVRHHGRFLEEVEPARAPELGTTIARLLAALMRAGERVPAPASITTGAWHDYLRHGFVDDPNHPAHGWREGLRSHAEAEAVFTESERRVDELLARCPERRDLVHADLLHQNVLVNDDATAVTGVFSWKCSVRGDFLYDVALCTFWGPWHPGVEAADVWGRAVDHGLGASAEAWVDAPIRHHAYELQIGASHLGWHVWLGDTETLAAVTRRTAAVLDRGPLTT